MSKRITVFKKFLMDGFAWTPKLMPWLFNIPQHLFKGVNKQLANEMLTTYSFRASPYIQRAMGGQAVRQMLVKVEPWKSKYEENLKKLQDSMQTNLKQTLTTA